MPEILVIKPSSLGDIIHGLQVVESIHQQLPEARITWIARDIFAPLVQASETVDEVLIFNRQAGPAAFFRLLGDIKSRSFDWVLDMQGLARSGLMTQAAKCPVKNKLGRSDAREFSSLAYGRRAPLPPVFAPVAVPPEARDFEGRNYPNSGQATGTHAHAIDILREFLPMMGLKRDLAGRLHFDTQKASGVVTAAAETLCKADGTFDPVVLFPSSRRKEKEWHSFEALAEYIFSETDKAIIWADSTKLDGPDLPPERFLNLSGNTSILDLVPLLNAASVVVCNDSGPMHLAAAMQRPIVACFGPTDPERYGPYPLSSPQNRVLVAPQDDLRQLSSERVGKCVVDLLMS